MVSALRVAPVVSPAARWPPHPVLRLRGAWIRRAGRAGGVASGAMASASGSSATVRLTQAGGAGGYGLAGATGGAGASSTLTNAVSGSTTGGSPHLYQT